MVETAGPLEFLPPHSPWPITTALGSVVVALGVVYGLGLFLLGLGVLAHGVFGMVFQYAGRPGPGAGQGSNSPLREGGSPPSRSR